MCAPHVCNVEDGGYFIGGSVMWKEDGNYFCVWISSLEDGLNYCHVDELTMWMVVEDEVILACGSATWMIIYGNYLRMWTRCGKCKMWI